MSDPQVVLYRYEMKNKRGKVLESSGAHASVYIESHSKVFPRVAELLKEAEIGFKSTLRLQPSEAFGDYLDDLVVEVPKSKFKSEVILDQQINVVTPSGKKQPMRVVDFKSDSVILDGNHEFAGIEIHMDIEVFKKRSASHVEMQSGQIQDMSF